jgi:hypothetical protein
MKKAIWLLLLALLLACGPSTTDSQPADTDMEDVTPVTSTEVTTEEIAEETAETNEEISENGSPTVAVTNLDDFSPAGTVAEAAVIREQDWRKGAADPAVVIIEYGDFQ